MTLKVEIVDLKIEWSSLNTLLDFSEESGHDFEMRGLSLARSLHDPMGTQGAVMFQKKERDGLFVSHDDINAYEFTTSPKKDKAVKDGTKLSELVKAIGDLPENKFKSRTGWFVTVDEPSAEQRSAIDAISRSTGERIHAISYATLYTRICDSEAYLRIRANAPFGSISLIANTSNEVPNVPVKLVGTTGSVVNVDDLAAQVINGGNALIFGNFGVGKSHTLRELYIRLRRTHFQKKRMSPFPIHINLRDCAGLKSPAEILRRHAEEIGFSSPDGLISAWRAGACILLLDGFDEIIPTRWFGSAQDLKTVRWNALSPVRRLVDETPQSSGIVVAGRTHYFSGDSEMTRALGFRTFEKYQIPDFDEEQLGSFMIQSNADWSIPDWVPMRPLLLGYLIELGATAANNVASSFSRASGWLKFIDAICHREAKMFSSVRPEVIKEIVSRVATLARSRADVTGPVDIEMLKRAFQDVNGYEPDEEGLQVLLRLPGLATAQSNNDDESRIFADRDLADAAYGLDLMAYSSNPYDDSHPLSAGAQWATASSDLGVEVAAEAMGQGKDQTKVILNALISRDNSGIYDSVMADLLRLAMQVTPDGDYAWPKNFLISGVYFENLFISDHPLYEQITFQDCVIDTLDLSQVEEGQELPFFQGTAIGFIDGFIRLPDWATPKFSNCDIAEFSGAAKTNSGIMQLNKDINSRIALTIFKKVYGQQGSGRKESALSRGLSLEHRSRVPEVIQEMISQGWISKSLAGKNTLYKGVRTRRSDVLRLLENPSDFTL